MGSFVTTTAVIAKTMTVVAAAATSMSEADAAALAAAVKAGTELRTEAWTLLAVAWIFIILRTIGRFISVPIRKFQPDDYLMIFAGLVYATETTQIHFIAGLGGSNNMPPEIRAVRTPAQIEDHILASKLFISGWVEYGLTVWLSKACMCFFFKRLFHGLEVAQKKVRIALWAVLGTYIIVFITTMCECIPFRKNWQVIPDPGQKCTQGLAKHIVILILNVATDMYLISIPLPIFLKSTMPLNRKIIITMLFGLGVFVTIAAILRSSFVFQDLYSSTLMAQWAVRESCVGFLVNNAPMLTPLYVRIAGRFRGSSLNSSPFSSKDVINTFYSRSNGKRKKKDGFTTTLGDMDEEISLENQGGYNHQPNRNSKSESTESINPGIRVDVEVELQYNQAAVVEKQRQDSNKKEKMTERLASGHLAGKDKGSYKAYINSGRVDVGSGAGGNSGKSG